MAVTKIKNVYIPDTGRIYNEQEAQQEVDAYIRELSKEIRGTSAPPAKLPDFFDLFQRAVRTRERQDNIPNCKGLLLKEHLDSKHLQTDDFLDTEAITWHLTGRSPGRLDQGPAGKGTIREVVPHIRNIRQHPEHPGEKLITMGKFYSTWITFNIYARDSSKALERVLWLEEVMDSFHWYFRLYGFRVVEEGVGDKTEEKIDDLSLIKYPMVYFIRSEEIYHVTSQELREVLIETNVSTT